MKNFKEKLAYIRAFVFDVDGVFTNGEISIDPEGDFVRTYNVKDGLAVVRARAKGYPIAIISGGKGALLRARMQALGIEHIYLAKESKVESMRDFARVSGVALEEMIYVGDDYPDVAPMRLAGLAVAPADAAAEVRAVADYTSKFNGGRGCVRDVIEQVMRVHGQWFTIDDSQGGQGI